MVRYLSITETRKKITSLEKDLSVEDTISVTSHGKEVLALLRWEAYEAIAETLEILSDEELSRELKQGIQDLANGNLIDLDDLKSEFNV
ncbi:MAG: type II toxin-antitoxin system Phd/YefM family antitoxin [Spirochaetales bacterium]|nr:type II toxin-antitoxin system Phd/YefM family antitoxin [Spirochaetales bacterium]